MHNLKIQLDNSVLQIKSLFKTVSGLGAQLDSVNKSRGSHMSEDWKHAVRETLT
jgi:hypothetical protein